jgi:transcriptional regulator with XRE-family HTH domain
MATALVPIDREVIRCFKLNCQLVQYRTATNSCRRCHSSLDEPEPEPEPVTAPPLLMPHRGGRVAGRGHSYLDLAATVRTLRLRNGFSQRELAERMSVPRTYVSKIENEKATPTLSSLLKIARALRVTVTGLIAPGEAIRRNEADELLRLPFIRTLLPYVSQLTPVERTCILGRVQDLIEQRRRRVWSTRLC